MNAECRKRLESMLRETGHALSLDDADDVAELDRLAQAVCDPSSGIDSALNDHPVYVRDIPVFPLTLAHLVYIDEGADALRLDDSMRGVFPVWVCTQSEIADEHWRADIMAGVVRTWARKCRWTEGDIQAVINLRLRRLVEAAGTREAKGQVGEGALVAMLAREYGGDPDYWLHRAPISVIEACVADWNRQQEAQASAYRRSSAGRGVAVPPAPSPKIKALRAMRECAERIEAKWRANP